IAVTAVIACPPSMVIVLMSAWMPAPPPESEPAMTSTRGIVAFKATFREACGANLSMRTTIRFRAQMRTKGSRRLSHGLANIVDQTLHQRRVVAFGHHANERLRAGFADDEAAAAFELRLCSGDPVLHRVGLERRLAAVEADVLEQLRHRIEEVEHLARRLL